MDNLLNILLMTQPQEGQNPYGSFIMLGAIIVVFYFFMIRPQMKKQKELKKFRDDLQKGDKVVTTGGIYGKVLEIQENVIIMEVEGQNRLKIDKAAVVKDMSDVAQK
ncbi:preprotein translocase subunit YajC [Labilibaculum filiforme]|uniref:Sec translocon accessory complex subunit YajC n=1 Tax=Labilibaculum filiforme TaxID=1940526 RepID=A0A2N3HW20_9BACT|nr:preprotein translocase subunit YajC [Labilibaculum filiforme]PKQ62275.1 preprotein translocase subunit YajC [Labilibaculum filiforme]